MCSRTILWWCSERLKFKIFIFLKFQFPFKGLDTTRLIGETFLRSVITHVRRFSTRSRSNTTGCSRINNCPCSYSSTEYLSWINDISPKAPNQNIFPCRGLIVFTFSVEVIWQLLSWLYWKQHAFVMTVSTGWFVVPSRSTLLLFGVFHNGIATATFSAHPIKLCPVGDLTVVAGNL